MKDESITIRIGEGKAIQSDSVILVPEMALTEAGYIKTFTLQEGAHAKHEFHAMSQMVYYQVQDDELAMTPVKEVVTVQYGDTIETIHGGIIIYRDLLGSICVLAHCGQNDKKLLETAHRFCTRWVRLDI